MALKELCKNYIEGRCKNHKCHRVHDYHRHQEFKHRAKELINAFDDSIDKRPSCYCYSTGAFCGQPAGCPFKHEIEVRRAVIESLGGKSLTCTIISEGPTNATPAVESVSHNTNHLNPSTKSRVPTLHSETSIKPLTRSRRNKNGVKKPRIVPYPKEDPSESIVSPIKGDWEKTPSWKFGILSIDRYNENREYGEYMTGIDAGKSPEQMIAKLRGAAPKSEFRNFGLFPYEIRQMVWKYAVKNHKTEVRLKFNYNMEFGRPANIKIRNSNCGPPLLHVNRECRRVALTRYEKLFGTNYSKPRIYFDTKVDRVFFDLRYATELSEMFRFIKPYDASRIHHMVVPLKDFVQNNERVISDAIAYFCNVKTLTIIYGDSKVDQDICTPTFMKFHQSGIKASIASSWRHRNNGRKGPKVFFQQIPAYMASFYKIDKLIW